MVTILYAVAVAGITSITGIHGDGRLFMLGAIAVASLLFSWRAGWVMLCWAHHLYIDRLVDPKSHIRSSPTLQFRLERSKTGSGTMSMILSVLVIQEIRLTQTEFESSRERSLASFSELLNERASLENRI